MWSSFLSKNYLAAFTVSFSVTNDFLGPGTAPLTKITLFSTSTLTTSRFWIVILLEPICIEDLQELGALIQVNADSVLGIDGRHFKRYTKKLLKAGLVDVIASDSHGTKERVCNMKKCYEYVAKKFGDDYAQEIMQTTPENIINGR